MAEHQHKEVMDNISDTASNEVVDKPQVVAVEATQDAPAYIKSLSPEQRIAAEKALVRKIDIRLIPMIVLIYIVSCSCLGRRSGIGLTWAFTDELP